MAAGLWSLPVRRAPARRSARSDAALRSCRERCRPLVARRRCCHFPSAFSPTKSTSHPPRMTDQPARAAPARSDRSSRSAYTMRHSPIHTPRLTALPRPPRAHLPLLHNCAESEICIPSPHPCVTAPRAKTAHACSLRQSHPHMLGHAHAAISPTSQPQPEPHSTERHSSQSGFSASPRSAHACTERAPQRASGSDERAASGNERRASGRRAAASERQRRARSD